MYIRCQVRVGLFKQWSVLHYPTKPHQCHESPFYVINDLHLSYSTLYLSLSFPSPSLPESHYIPFQISYSYIQQIPHTEDWNTWRPANTGIPHVRKRFRRPWEGFIEERQHLPKVWRLLPNPSSWAYCDGSGSLALAWSACGIGFSLFESMQDPIALFLTLPLQWGPTPLPWPPW